MQTTLLSFAIGLILALLAALVAPHFINWNDHRAFFEAEASRLVGLNVRVAGDIHVGILPVPSVTLRGIAIGPVGRDSRMQAKSLGIELALGPLMRGEMRATEMKLVGPRFDLGLDDQGQIDWPPLALASDTLSIDRLHVEDGRATLTDAGSKMKLVLDQLWFTGEVRSLTGPIRGKGEFVAEGGLYGYEVSAGRMGPDGTRVKLSLKTDERPLTVEADGLLTFDRTVPRFDGALTLSRPAMAVLASGKAVAYEPWRLTSKIKAGVSAAVLDEVAFQYGPDERAVALTGAANFKFGAKPHLDGQLTARQVDLDRMLATPKALRLLPVSALQALGEMLGGALRPSWPVSLKLKADAMTLGGSAVQNVAADLRSNGATWLVDRLRFRAPGFSKVKADGRVFALGKGLGFVGKTHIDSNDPKNLVAWLAGQGIVAVQMVPWHFDGDITLGPERIAVERLKSVLDRDTIEGSVSYVWPAGDRPARLDADLRAAEFDLDGALALARSTLAGLGLERPGEFGLALDIGHAHIAGIDARDISAKFRAGADGLAIERLSVASFGNTGIVATGNIRTNAPASGAVTLYLDARDLSGLVGLADQFAPAAAMPLRTLAARQKTAVLRATIGLDDGAADTTTAKLALSGQIGAIRVNLTGDASAKRAAFSLTDLARLRGADVHIGGQVEAEDSAQLLNLLGLDRALPAESEPKPASKPAQLYLAASGPLGRDLKFEGKLDAGPIEASGSGVLRLPSGEQPAAVDLDHLSGSIAGHKVRGRLALHFGDAAKLDGAVEMEQLDAATVIAAAIGSSRQRPAGTTGWSTDPVAWHPPGLSGAVAFKTREAALLPGLAARNLNGKVRFNGAEVVFEEISGDIAKGRLEGRLALTGGDNGVTARLRVGVTNAEAGALWPDAERPPVSGRLAFQTEVEGSGRSPATLIGSLTGFGSIALEQGRLAGLDADVFGAVSRAAELGIVNNTDRLRAFVAGVLDSGRLPIAKASAAISINAGQARLRDVAIKAEGADLQAIAGADLADASLDALLTLSGVPSAPGAPRPSVLVALKGPLTGPKRAVDAGLLASWLTLRAVDQKSKEIDAMEQARRDGAQQPAAPRPDQPAYTPMSIAPGMNTGNGLSPQGRAPALPPPIDVPAGSKPQVAPRADNGSSSGVVRPPNLVGAQD